jgi:hypothetical protein
MLDNLTISYIKEIQEASQQNRLVAFVGAGASCDAGVPLWNGLVDRMANVLPQEIQAKYDNLQLAQLVKETCDEKAYYASVRKHLLQDITCPNAIHDAILELDPNCIITTNYDTLLEEATLRKNQQFWVVSKDSDLPQNHGERLLVKMHGDLDSENIVLTENDYYDYSRNFPLIRSFVVSQFVSKVVLFIGFSFSDINLRYILREVQSELGPKMQKAFLLTQDTPSPVELNNLKAKGVNVLSITPSIAQEVIGILKLDPHPDHFLSERGRTLVSQLVILRDYRESCQLIDLLIDFFDNQVEGLTVSGHYIKYAFPKDMRKGFHFEGRNLDLPDIYKDEFLTLFSSRKSIIRLWRKYGNKLQQLRHILLDNDVSSINNTSIYSLCSGRRRSKYSKPSAVQAYFQMDINNLKHRIKSLRGRSLAYNIEDLELPYVLFLSGYYYEAYEMYSMLAPEMWKRRKYTLFFICLYNKHSVAWPAIRSIQDRKDMDCENIKRFYYRCDLTKELNMLPLSECVHMLFSDLIYHHQLSDALIVTSNTSGKIAQQRQRAEERTGWSMNSNIKKVFTNFVYFFDFCVDNFLVTDNNAIGTQFYSTVVRSMLDSVLTPADGPQSKLDALNELSLYVILFKLTPKVFKELISDVVKNKKFPVTKDFINDLKRNVENLFLTTEDMGSYGKLPLKEHVLMNWLQNILLIIPHIADMPEIEHLDMVIARLWRSSHLVDRMKDIVAYFQSYAPCSDAAQVLLYESLESVCHDGDIIDFVMAISDSTRNLGKEWDERRVMRGVEFQGSVRVAAAVLHATGNQMSLPLKEWILDNAKTLYDIALAQSFTKEKLLTIEIFDKFKSNLYEDQNPYERENFVSLLANYYNFANEDYADLKGCIENLANEIPCLRFALNPLEWVDFENIDCRWMGYVSEELYDDILKNEMAKKKLKEYCESVPWGKEIKEVIWKKL